MNRTRLTLISKSLATCLLIAMPALSSAETLIAGALVCKREDAAAWAIKMMDKHDMPAEKAGSFVSQTVNQNDVYCTFNRQSREVFVERKSDRANPRHKIVLVGLETPEGETRYVWTTLLHMTP